MAHALPAPLPAADASLAVASLRQVYRASPDYTLYSAALEQAPTFRHMPTSPVTSPKPTMVRPPPLPLGSSGGGIRWMPQAEETASGDHYGHNHLSLPRAPPRAQSRHSELSLQLSKRRRSDGDTGETPYHLTRSGVDEWRASAMAEADVVGGRAYGVPPGVVAEHPSDTLPTPRGGNAAHHCPSYVKQRQEHWSTVMNKTDRVGVAGSAEKEEDGAHVAGHVSVLTPRLRDLTLHAPAPPPFERQTLAGVYGYRGGLNGPVCGGVSLIHAPVLPDGADGTEPPSRKRRAQLMDEATDIWGVDPAAYNVSAGGDGWEQDGGSGGGSSGSDSGNIGDGDDALRAHVCFDCPHRFKRAYDLTQHKAAVHAKLRPYSCKMCGRTFGHVGTRTKHYRTIHIGIKLHGCDFCDQRFSEKGNMRRHVERSHPTAVVPL